MYYESCEKTTSEDSGTAYVTILGTCAISGQPYSVKLERRHYELLESGENIAHIIGAPDMEFLISGISPSGWEDAFSEK